MYLCALRPGGQPIDRDELQETMRRLGGDTDLSMLLGGCFAAAVPVGARLTRPLVTRWRHLIAVGDVRLDNRPEIAELAGVANAGSDLDLVLRALDERGEKAVEALLGDFGVVVWDARAHKLIAARDAFGVKPLYFRTAPDMLLFSDRMDAIAEEGRYDAEYMADFLTGLMAVGQRTIWADVREVPAGGFLLQRGTARSARRYWSPETFTTDDSDSDTHRIEEFRSLFREGVRTRLGPRGTTWAQLSGGVDSSSVVAMAQNLVAPGQGLAGTVSLVDSIGACNERRYSDAVAQRYGLLNEQIHDCWAWQQDASGPPRTDGPRPLYPFFSRDRRMFETVRRSGARVVLSGFGSDHYLAGNPNYLADLVARGRLTTATRELARWSIASRQSFWTLSLRHVLQPLASAVLGGARGASSALPSWVVPSFATRYGVAERTLDVLQIRGAPGRQFEAAQAHAASVIPTGIDRWPWGDEIEVRYPFLYRPLVEAALRMPPRLRVRAGVGKWVLREAMRGLVPEQVRTRVTKGIIDARLIWSLQRERGSIAALLEQPILADFCCIDPARLRLEVDAARRGVPTNLVMLVSALSLETWLAVRAGRWPVQPVAAQTAA